MKPIGDTELWLAKGGTRQEDGRVLHWRLPMYARPVKVQRQKHYIVQAAMHFKADHYRMLAASLAPLAAQKSGNRWLIDYHLFQSRFEKAPGVTPKYYFRWKARPATTAEEEQIPEPEHAPDMGADEYFIPWLRSRVPMDPKDLVLAWRFITRLIPQYLLETGRSVNMSFAKITAVPFRANWKNMVVGQNPELARIYKLTTVQRAELVRYSNATRSFRRAELIETAKTPKGDVHFVWNLEISPSKSWNRFARETEASRITALGRNYPTHWANCVTKAENQIHEILSVFTRKISAACATVRECLDDGSISFGQKYKVEPLRRNRLWTFTDTTACLPDPETFIDEDPPEDLLDPEDEGLSQVPLVFTSDEDLRDSRGDDD